jgi:CspA family cold shock protein
MTTNSVKGSVKFFNAAKGFGFIAPDDGGKDVFVPAASITASGLGKLKAGQRVSFDCEPDSKGPKAVGLKLLDEMPAAIIKEPANRNPAPANFATPHFAPAHIAPAHSAPIRPAIAVYHDPATQDVEPVLDALAAAGHTPRLVDVVATPPEREELRQLSLLLRDADQSLVKRYDTLFLALQLDDRFISENDFWTGIAEHPRLINGPVVAMAGKARLCRTAEDVRALMGPDGSAAPSAKPKGISPRMAAMVRGEAVAPLPAKRQPEPVAVKVPEKAEARPAAPTAKPAPLPLIKPKVETRLETKAEAKPAAKAAIKAPLKAVVKKAAAKPAAKAKAPAAKAKKKK